LRLVRPVCVRADGHGGAGQPRQGTAGQGVHVVLGKGRSFGHLATGKDFAALPVRNREQLRLDARLNAPAHVYVLWLDSDGRVTPLYPWNERKLVIRDAAVPPPPRPVLAEVGLPLPNLDGASEGYIMRGKSGLDTIFSRGGFQRPIPAPLSSRAWANIPARLTGAARRAGPGARGAGRRS
jgi:hypothetical protein